MAYVLAFSLPLAVILIATILKRWSFGVYLGFFWILFGDTIRKLIPGQPAYLILVGDLIFLITYLSFFVWSFVRGKKVWTPPFLLPLILFSIFVLIEVFNPLLPNFLVGLIGLRSFLWFLPLIFLGHSFFESDEARRKTLKGFVYLSIPFFILAVVQLTTNSDLPFLKNFEDAWQVHSFGADGFGDLEKIPSFFGSDQRYGMISMLWFFLGMGLYNGRNKLLALSILSALGGVIISGSRSAFVLTILGIILFFLFLRKEALRKNIEKVFKIFSWKKLFLAIGGILVVLLILYFFRVAIGLDHLMVLLNVFNSRLPEFLLKDLPSVTKNISLFGYGTGTLAQGHAEIGQFEGPLKEVAYIGGETGVKRIIFELGLVGFLIFYFFWGRILFLMKRSFEKLQSFETQKVVVAILVFVILILVRFTFVHHQVLGDSAVLASLWFFIGVFFKLTKNEDIAHSSDISTRL